MSKIFCKYLLFLLFAIVCLFYTLSLTLSIRASFSVCNIITGSYLIYEWQKKYCYIASKMLFEYSYYWVAQSSLGEMHYKRSICGHSAPDVGHLVTGPWSQGRGQYHLKILDLFSLSYCFVAMKTLGKALLRKITLQITFQFIFLQKKGQTFSFFFKFLLKTPTKKTSYISKFYLKYHMPHHKYLACIQVV